MFATGKLLVSPDRVLYYEKFPVGISLRSETVVRDISGGRFLSLSNEKLDISFFYCIILLLDANCFGG